MSGGEAPGVPERLSEIDTDQTDLVRVTFPGGSLQVKRGTVLSRALNLDALRIETPCGGRGRCRKCLVQVIEGEAPPTPSDLDMLWPQEVDAGYRLACRLTVTSDITVTFEPIRPVNKSETEAGSGRRVCEVPAGDSSFPDRTGYGVAIDLGTTSIAAVLVQLPGGKEIASGSVPNPQASFGADVMTRLGCAIRSREDSDLLQAAVLDAMAGLIRSMAAAAGICIDRVTSGVLVCNSVMHHLVLGFDASGLAEAPYTPSVTGAISVDFPGLPPIYAAPLIGGFAGSDAVAAALSEGMHRGSGTRLLIDLGTNSEILLAHRGILFACSAPAGPAFEGAEISQGMLASVGAIDSVRIEGGQLRFTVIGGGEPSGLCGSGLIDAVHALLQLGLIDQSGRLRSDTPVRGCTTESGVVRIPGHGNPTRLEVAPAVSLTQKDIRAVQLAKGAVRAGIEVLLRSAGAGTGEVDEVFLAGTFGSFVRPESAVATGLLPRIPASRVKSVGNAALRGAKMMLESKAMREEGETLAKSVRHVSLYDYPGFEDVFMRSLEFPAI